MEQEAKNRIHKMVFAGLETVALSSISAVRSDSCLTLATNFHKTEAPHPAMTLRNDNYKVYFKL